MNEDPSAPAVDATPGKSATTWQHLKQRKVVQWTLAYVALAYGLVEAVDLVGHAFGWPAIIYRMVMVGLAVGVPIAALLAWYHGERGQQRISGPELTILTVLFLIAGSVLWLLARSTPEPSRVPAAATTSTPVASPPAVAAEATTPRASIAVLAFANLTGEPGKEYFSDGMAEELINALAGVPGLKVPARTSSFAYKGRDTDTRKIAQDLGVSVVLEGSVRSAGERVRVTAQLIDGQTGYHLWSQSYDREFTDLFALQDDLAREIVQALGSHLHVDLPSEVTQAAPTQDLQAYELYLQAQSLANRPSPGNLRTTLELLQRATLRDPQFARAYSLMARALLLSVTSAATSDSDELVDAELAAQRALSLDDRLSESRAVLAQIHAFRGDLIQARRDYEAALALDDSDPILKNLYGYFLLNVGQFRQSLEVTQRAHQLAPAIAVICLPIAVAYSFQGSDAAAIRYVELAVNLGIDPHALPIPLIRSHVALRRHAYEAAGEYMLRALPSDLRDSGGDIAVRLVYAALADPAQKPAAMNAVQGLTANAIPSTSALTPVLIIHWYTLLGELDAAYAVLDETVASLQRSGMVGSPAFGGFWVPELQSFRQDSRFRRFADTLQLSNYWRIYGPPDHCELRDDQLTCT